jgi:hypothetical protein
MLNTFNPTGAVPAPTVRRHEILKKLMEIARRAPGNAHDAETLRMLVNCAVDLADLLGVETCRTNRAELRRLELGE